MGHEVRYTGQVVAAFAIERLGIADTAWERAAIENVCPYTESTRI